MFSLRLSAKVEQYLADTGTHSETALTWDRRFRNQAWINQLSISDLTASSWRPLHFLINIYINLFTFWGTGLVTLSFSVSLSLSPQGMWCWIAVLLIWWLHYSSYSSGGTWCQRIWHLCHKTEGRDGTRRVRNPSHMYIDQLMNSSEWQRFRVHTDEWVGANSYQSFVFPLVRKEGDGTFFCSFRTGCFTFAPDGGLWRENGNA